MSIMTNLRSDAYLDLLLQLPFSFGGTTPKAKNKTGTTPKTRSNSKNYEGKNLHQQSVIKGKWILGIVKNATFDNKSLIFKENH